MTGFIFHPRSNQIIKQVEVVSYELPYEATSTNLGEVEIVEPEMQIQQLGLIINGNRYKITEAEYGNEKTRTIKVANQVALLEGYPTLLNANNWDAKVRVDVSYSDVFKSNSYGLNWMNSSSYSSPIRFNMCLFAPKYIAAKRSSGYSIQNFIDAAEATGIPATIFAGDCIGTQDTSAPYRYTYLASVQDMLEKLISMGFTVSLEYEANPPSGYLPFIIANVGLLETRNTPIPVFFNDGHSELLSEAYNDDVVSQITLERKNWNNSQYLSVDWFLDEAGVKHRITNSDDPDITPMIGAPRREIASFTLDSEASQAELNFVDGIFAENSWNHKIKFASDKQFHIGQPVRLMLKRSVLDTKIDSVFISSSDNRYIYTCGDLPVQASDKIVSNDWHYGRRTPRAAAVGSFYIT